MTKIINYFNMELIYICFLRYKPRQRNKSLMAGQKTLSPKQLLHRRQPGLNRTIQTARTQRYYLKKEGEAAQN